MGSCLSLGTEERFGPGAKHRELFFISHPNTCTPINPVKVSFNLYFCRSACVTRSFMAATMLFFWSQELQYLDKTAKLTAEAS